MRKTEIKREKRRKTCVFRGASFLYALRGGDKGSRTREQFPAEIVPKVPPKFRRLMQYGRIGMLWFIGGDNP